MGNNHDFSNPSGLIGRVIRKLKNNILLGFLYRELGKISSSHIAVISLCITFLATISLYLLYGIGYSFLYGFYFGGTLSNSPSLMEMFIFPVPFTFRSLIIVSIILVIGALFVIIFTISLLRVINSNAPITGRSKEFLISFLFILCITVFLHTAITVFFVNGINMNTEKILSFGVIWITPIMMAMAIGWMISIKENIFASFIEFIAAIFLLALLYVNKQWLGDSTVEYFSGLLRKGGVSFFDILPHITFFVALVLYFIRSNIGLKKGKLSLFLRVVYYIIILETLVLLLDLYVISNHFNKETYIFTLLIAIILPFFKPFSLSFFWKKKKGSGSISQREKEYITNNKKIILFLGIVSFLFVITILSYQSFSSGRAIREAVNKVRNDGKPSNFLADKITISNSKEPIYGFVVTTDDNGVYYISNNEWRLVTIKNLSIITQPKK